MFADLHLHTNFSDGTYTPEELTGHGKRLGFAALALTDHDTMEVGKHLVLSSQYSVLSFAMGAAVFTED